MTTEDKFISKLITLKLFNTNYHQLELFVMSELDWDSVLASAQWHFVGPLLYQNIKNLDNVPKHVGGSLKMAFFHHTVNNLILYKELSEVLKAFNDKGVSVIVLKGAFLAEKIYKNIGLRPMCDIDLLVREVDLQCAESILVELGYNYYGEFPREVFRKKKADFLYRHPNKKMPIELHWHISKATLPLRIRFDGNEIMENLWQRARHVILGGQKTLTFCPEDQVLYLSFHFIKHRFQGQNRSFISRGALLQLVDIFHVIKHFEDTFSWELLYSEAVKYGMESLIYLTFYLIQSIIGDVPSIQKGLKPFEKHKPNKEIIDLIQKRIFVRSGNLATAMTNFIVFPEKKTWSEKISALLRRAFPPPSVIAKMYNVSTELKQVYVYYIIHSIELLVRYSKISQWKIRFKEEKIFSGWIHFKDKN